MILLEIVYYAFIVVVFIQVIFYTFFFGRFSFSKIENKTNKKVPISIIICAKNEAKNLKRFLPSILNQDYPDFEVVLINDASYDDTPEIMEQFAKQYNNIKIVDVKNVEAFWGNKKYALTLGIKASTNDYLLFTDADCKPVSKSWISEMTTHFNEDIQIVLGYGAYNKIKNSFLNKLIRFETLVTAIQYFSFAKIGIPYMGVGRNLAYSKDAFYKANGFVDHMQVRSGDDDLFINQVATKKNTAISLTKDSFTTSVPKKTFRTWYKQKRRHLSTAKHYKFIHKFLLSLIYACNFLFWALAITLFVVIFNWQIVLGLVLFKLILQGLVYSYSTKKLHEKDLIYLFPVLEVFLIIIQLSIFINNLISKPNHWK